MKKTVIISIVLIIFSFIVFSFIFYTLTYFECFFWFGIILLLISFLTKKNNFNTSFGIGPGPGLNGQSNFLFSTNSILASKGSLYKLNLYNITDTGKNKFVNLSFLLFIFGLLFLILSFLESFI